MWERKEGGEWKKKEQVIRVDFIYRIDNNCHKQWTNQKAKKKRKKERKTKHTFKIDETQPKIRTNEKQKQ